MEGLDLNEVAEAIDPKMPGARSITLGISRMARRIEAMAEVVKIKKDRRK